MDHSHPMQDLTPHPPSHNTTQTVHRDLEAQNPPPTAETALPPPPAYSASALPAKTPYSEPSTAPPSIYSLQPLIPTTSPVVPPRIFTDANLYSNAPPPGPTTLKGKIVSKAKLMALYGISLCVLGGVGAVIWVLTRDKNEKGKAGVGSGMGGGGG